MSEEISFEDSVDNTSVSDSSSLEAELEELSVEKESGDLFRSESGIDTSALEFNSEGSEADVSISSFGKKSMEDELEVEQEETGNESKSFNDTADSSISSFGKKSMEDELEAEQEETGNESKSFNDTADSSISSFGKKSMEDELEVEQEETGNESKSFNDTKQTISARAKSQQLATEGSTAHSSTSILVKGLIEDVFGDERDGIGNKSFDNTDPNPTVSTKSPKLETEALKKESSASNLDKAMIEEPIKQINLSTSVEEGETGKKLESVSNAEQSATSGNKHSLSPTEAMKALRISETPSSASKGTPRQSRFRAKTFNIFDSPYNTRLKARMIQEREMRSRSQGEATDE
ncbi:serine-rich adhesin for platelets [Parasteatoda tepidariorum]|uniref:serine-rich adhesin for platelets n=1 Tax=Parasteatoda tepidariorum TaxID=114398 RepID=UPI001C71CEBF|nr:dentin sialophosphoprotein [Parasteatoda tepidariorum]XP_042904819.1 dentin sialophosphoprotein [Parasteatoda tepidariorum]